MPDDTSIEAVQQRVMRPLGIRNLIPRLPERGKIKIGKKGGTITSGRGNEFRPPQKLDHFRVTTLERGPDGNFVVDPEFARRFGDHPTEIPVRLLYDDPHLNFVTRYACFLGRTLWCSGNGETATRISEAPPKDRAEAEALHPEPRTVTCTCFRQDPAYTGRDKCKMNGNLSVIIEGASGLGGVWNFRTTSYNSIVGIMSSMELIRQISGGVLANIPLKLKLQPKQATAPTDSSQVTIYVVGLEFAGNVEQLQEMGHNIALARATTHVSIREIEHEARQRLALAPPAPLPDDDIDDVVEEFYPEQVETSDPQEPRSADSTPMQRHTFDVPVDNLPEEEGELPSVEEDNSKQWFFVVIDENGLERGCESAEEAEAAIKSALIEASCQGPEALEETRKNNRANVATLPRAAQQRLKMELAQLQGSFVRAHTAEVEISVPPGTRVTTIPTVPDVPWEQLTEPADLPQERAPAAPMQVVPHLGGGAPTSHRAVAAREAPSVEDRGVGAMSLEILPPPVRGRGPSYASWWEALFLPALEKAETRDAADAIILVNQRHIDAYMLTRQPAGKIAARAMIDDILKELGE